MARSALPRIFGRRHAKHRRGRGDPMRAAVAIPLVVVVAAAVGAGAYALSGGFSSTPQGSTALRTTTIPPSTRPQVLTTTTPSGSPTSAASTSTSTSTTSTSTTTTSTTTTSTTTPTTIPTVAPSSVSVEVLNGSGVQGEAGTVAAQLTQAGFDVVGTTDAQNFGYTTTVIEYAPGGEAAAATVAQYLVGPVSEQPSSAEAPGAVTVIIGSTLSDVRT